AERALAQARREAGVAPTTPDSRLARAARAIAEDNAARGELDHVDAKGGTLRSRAMAENYAFRLVAENLAMGTQDGARVIELWRHSPEHRANLLQAGAVHHGLARVRGPDGRDYWAAVFGAPLR
ncbi:MAG: CAP domain-containing protein, partial [Tagaea sp.]|nr:CAP domain-containing protein [Tagaea sp.]